MQITIQESIFYKKDITIIIKSIGTKRNILVLSKFRENIGEIYE